MFSAVIAIPNPKSSIFIPVLFTYLPMTVLFDVR